MEEVHGLHRADGVWRATGRGARAYRKDRRTPGLKPMSREEWLADLHRQGLTPSLYLRERALAAAAERGMSKGLRKVAERDAAKASLAPPTVPPAAALTGAVADSSGSDTAAASAASESRQIDQRMRTGSIASGDVSSAAKPPSAVRPPAAGRSTTADRPPLGW